MPDAVRCCTLALVLLLPTWASAAKKAASAPLVEEHAHPSGAFTFKTPAGWKTAPVAGNPDLYQATDGTVLLRFLFHEQETGYDGLHAVCMLERLAPAMETAPSVQYEYDYVSWIAADRRVLDSAFVVKYDQPVQGSRDWRQRNLTVVGGGESLCIITYVPAAVWRKSAALRATLEEVVRSITFRRQATPASPAPAVPPR
jgi:hypothetical protein